MTMKRIESRENPVFRQIDRIRRQNGGAEDGILFLEGLRLCQDAVQSGVRVIRVILNEAAFERKEVQEFLTAVSPEEETVLLSERLFSALAGTNHPQGIALLCEKPLISPDQLAARPDGLYLVLEGVADPGNVGTLIRTADAFAFDGILLLPQTASPYNDKAIRSSMGSCFHVPLISLPDLSALDAYLKKAGLALYAADLNGISILEEPFDRAGAILIGNEARGISAEARLLCDRLVTIPMPGRAESLKAAAAGAILCHELRRAHHITRGSIVF